MRVARENNPTPLGEMPLIVISRGIPITGGVTPAERDADHKRLQADLATFSRNGRHVIAERSGHHPHIEEPELLVGAIREVVTAARNVDATRR